MPSDQLSILLSPLRRWDKGDWTDDTDQVSRDGRGGRMKGCCEGVVGVEKGA